MVFSVVKYRCESWTIKKAECWRTDAFELWRWRRLESPSDSKIKPVNSKGNQAWIFIGRTAAKLKLQYFGYLIWRADSLENTLILGKIEDRWRERQRMRWHHSTWWTWVCTDSEGQGTLAVYETMRSQGVRHNWATEQHQQKLYISWYNVIILAIIFKCMLQK